MNKVLTKFGDAANDNRKHIPQHDEEIRLVLVQGYKDNTADVCEEKNTTSVSSKPKSVFRPRKSDNRQRRPSYINKRTIRVSNIDTDTSYNELKNLFELVGRIDRVNIIKNKQGHSTGIAYITYKHEDDCDKAVKSFDGYKYGYTVLTVEYAVEYTVEYADGYAEIAYKGR